MRSPFPGMDPYLEDPGGWGGVHDAMIALLREQLNRQLGAGFIADGDTRVYIVSPDEQHWIFLAAGTWDEATRYLEACLADAHRVSHDVTV